MKLLFQILILVTGVITSTASANPCDELVGPSNFSQAFEQIANDGSAVVPLSNVAYPIGESSREAISAAVYSYEAIKRSSTKYEFDHRALRGLTSEWGGYIEKLNRYKSQDWGNDIIAFVMNGLLNEKLRLQIDFTVGRELDEAALLSVGPDLLFVKVETKRPKNVGWLVIHSSDSSARTVRAFDPATGKNRTYVLGAGFQMKDSSSNVFGDPRAWVQIVSSMRFHRVEKNELQARQAEILTALRKYKGLIYEHESLISRKIYPLTRAQLRNLLNKYHGIYLDGKETVAKDFPSNNSMPKVAAALMEIEVLLQDIDEVAKRLKFWQWLEDNDLKGYGKVSAIELSQYQVVQRLDESILKKRDSSFEQIESLKLAGPSKLDLSSIAFLTKAVSDYLNLARELENQFPVSRNIHQHALQTLYESLSSILDQPEYVAELRKTPFGIFVLQDWRTVKTLRQLP